MSKFGIKSASSTKRNKTKLDIVNRIYERAQLMNLNPSINKKDINTHVNRFFELWVDTYLRTGEFRINNFLVMEKTSKGSRPGRNPRTGEDYEVSARTVPKVRFSPNLKIHRSATCTSTDTKLMRDYMLAYEGQFSNLIHAMTINTIREFMIDGYPMEIRGLGKLYTKACPERKTRNPQTGESVITPAGFYPMFKPSNAIIVVED